MPSERPELDCVLRYKRPVSRRTRSSSLARLSRLVGALGLGQPSLDSLDPVLVAGMVAEELGWLLTLGRAQHALPKGHRLTRVVPGPGHVDQPDMVGLGLLRAAE